MTQKYKVAIVGCGGISRAHGEAWKNLPEIDLVGACDRKFEPLAEFAKAFNVKQTYKDLRRMLERQAPDILVVATWPTLHLKHILEGIRAGVPAILCEKPIAINATQAEQMKQVAISNNTLLMEGFMYRHHPLTLAVKQRILDGAIGEVRFVRATFSTGLTDRTNWRLRGDLGGGAVMDLGCYCINCIRYLIGAEPVSVWATGRFEPISDVWETLIGTLDFGNGVTGQFDCSFGWTWREGYEVVGTTGTITVPRAWSNGEGECNFTVVSDGQTERVQVAGVNPYRAEILSLCEALSTGRLPLLPTDDALWNMRVIDGVHESAHTGQCIAIPSETVR
ncbi:MAG: Gfo/Idh/MocA family oxidoreductase [Candidatus Poribacteria bacterium]|nr:Gfo/Idh/MocA family oxidoreductase [Candidatus Poribacteria bacterium]